MAQEFGITSKGEAAKLFRLKNKKGMTAAVSDYGASLVEVCVPDRNGKLTDVVLGYDDVSGYETGSQSIGATVGRIANRIKGAEFTLNGKVYKLAQNDNGNNLHSGPDVYNHRLWGVKEADDNRVVFTLSSPDNDQGYPGEVEIEVSYTLTEENEIKIHYYAVPKEDTIINMTNHSYFNLAGHDAGDILNQELKLYADAYTEADEESIPTGEILSVKGTPMDFRTKKAVGRDIEEAYEALLFGGGYDHNWVLNNDGYCKVGEFTCCENGITMEIYTDLPGIQVYSGNFLDGERGKEGAVYRKRQGICFETQYFPDAIHKDNFEGPVVKAGEVYETVTAYRFVKQKDS